MLLPSLFILLATGIETEYNYIWLVTDVYKERHAQHKQYTRKILDKREM